MEYARAIFVLFSALLLSAERVTNAEEPATYLFIPDRANFVVYVSGTGSYAVTNDKLILWKIDKEIGRLSSGARIQNAGDDPSGLAVSDKMRSLIEGLTRESMNAEDFRDYLASVESAVASEMEIVKRLRAFAVQGENGIYGEDDREILQREADELIDQIDESAASEEFNRARTISDLSSKSLGLDEFDIIGEPDKAIGIADRALSILTSRRTAAGVKSNILSFEIEGKSRYIINMTGSMSRITDDDMAEEISKLVEDGIALRMKYGIAVKAK